MKNDRINRIHSRTIKLLVACMRVNLVLRKMVPGLEFVPLLSRADSPALMGGRSALLIGNLYRDVVASLCAKSLNSGQSGHGARTVRQSLVFFSSRGVVTLFGLKI